MKFRTMKISSEGLCGCAVVVLVLLKKGEGEPGYGAIACNCRVFDVRSDPNCICATCRLPVHSSMHNTSYEF